MALAMQTNPARKALSPNSLPMEIRKAVVETNTLCTESGGRPGKSSKLIKFVDLNGDGVTDYLMDLAYYECEGAASAVSAGQSGSAVTIFVGGPNNTARKALNTLSQDTQLETSGGRPRVYVAVMGPDCGQKPSANRPMSQVAVCSRPLNWDAAKQAFVLAPLSEKRPFVVQ